MNNFVNKIDEINLFDDRNKELRKYFLFFFLAAVCAYLSLMCSFCPFSDDSVRYIQNIPVGTMNSGRYMTLLLELFVYFSEIITDASPFSYVISCIFLAYSAILCLKIFKVNLEDKIEILCFIPVIANPYLLEAMMFRFDNPYFTISLFLVVLSAYLSTSNSKRWLFAQTALLILSLFMYQGASSAYLIIFVYLFIKQISEGNELKNTIIQMRYWFYTLILTAICYLPFTLLLAYSSAIADCNIFLIPKNSENIAAIIKNIKLYFSVLYEDWSVNTIGTLFGSMLIMFIIKILSDTVINASTKTKSIGYFFFVAAGIVIFFMTPFGVCFFLKVISFKGNETFSRVLYSMGILISAVLYTNYKVFKKVKISYIVFSFLIASSGLWNLIFLNSAGNIIYTFCKLRDQVFYDISKDIYEITDKNKKISRVCVVGSVETGAMKNFFELYPIMNRIIPEKWNIPDYCRVATINSKFAEQMLKYAPLNKLFVEQNYKNKQILKHHMWYDISIMDDKMLYISLKKQDFHKKPIEIYAKIADENE